MTCGTCKYNELDGGEFPCSGCNHGRWWEPKMNGIISELSQCASEYEARTGRKPTQFHLGRSELLALGQWAYARGYIDDERKVAFMDSGEPHKVMGLKINAVDEDSHMRVSE